MAPGARECCKPWLDSVWVRHPGSSWSSFQQALQMSFLRSVSPKIDQARGRGAGRGSEGGGPKSDRVWTLFRFCPMDALIAPTKMSPSSSIGRLVQEFVNRIKICALLPPGGPCGNASSGYLGLGPFSPYRDTVPARGTGIGLILIFGQTARRWKGREVAGQGGRGITLSSLGWKGREVEDGGGAPSRCRNL